MYECGKLKKVIGNKSLFPVILEQCDVNKHSPLGIQNNVRWRFSRQKLKSASHKVNLTMESLYHLSRCHGFCF